MTISSSPANLDRLETVVTSAIGPRPDYAMGYLNPVGKAEPPTGDGTGYIATMKLSAATVPIDGLDVGTEGIVSYDRCETADANIGQINMGTASSFCGINGALWGHDLVKAGLVGDPLVDNVRDLFTPEDLKALSRKGKRVASTTVHSAQGLLDATERLFGHAQDPDPKGEKQRRHPPLPGAHVICANKSVTVRGPAYAFAFIAIAISPEPDRFSSLFIEDCATIPVQLAGDCPTLIPDVEQTRQLLVDHRNAVLKSIALCGDDFGVEYQTAFIAGKATYAGPNDVACALACAPYVLLAQKDILQNKQAKDLLTMNLEEWDKAVWDTQPNFQTSFHGDKNGIDIRTPTLYP